MRKFLMATVAAGGLLLGNAADAAPIAANSVIGWTGNYQAQNPVGTPSGLGSATHIDFAPAGGPGGNIFVTSLTGDFLALAPLPFIATILDFALPSASIPGFVVATNGGNTLTIDVTSMNIIFQADSGLTIGGTSMMTLTGYDPTPGTYELSFQTAGGNPISTQFQFTSSGNAAPIPEPGTLALLGLGLLGMGAAVRGRRQPA